MLPWMREKLYGSRQKLVNILSRRCESVPRREVLQRENMFVSDTNLFSSDEVKLMVISNEGSVWTIDAAPDMKIDKLKTMALCHFYNPLECVKLAPSYKLVLVTEVRRLDNENSISQEGLRSNDKLLLVEYREQQPPSREPYTADNIRGPTVEEIRVATQDALEKNVMKLHPPLECSSDFQTEIRKILISLVEASAHILTPGPNADEVFQAIREKLEAKAKAQPDPQSVRRLIEMGFSEKAARRALQMNRMNQTEALDWLLENGGENNVDEDEVEVQVPDPKPGSSGASKKQPGASVTGTTSSKSKKELTVTQNVTSLLESFRAFKRRDFKPNAKALQNLLDMGFPEEDVRDALRITGNNQSAACEWLLGERRPSLEDLDSGLDPEGPIYKAIMSNPVIQLSLTSPKMLLAFLSILESPSSANLWINDPDASPVLSQIFKTYHSEKHAIQMNSYVEQQQDWSARRS